MHGAARRLRRRCGPCAGRWRIRLSMMARGGGMWRRSVGRGRGRGGGLCPALVDIVIGGVPVFELGLRSPSFDETAAHAAMMVRDYTIRLDMGLGKAECRFLTCDLTEEDVRIKADYST